MTRQEMNLRIFRREPVPHVFFQPRFEPWFDWSRRFGELPEEISAGDVRDAYDVLDASMRTVNYYTGQPAPIVTTYASPVSVEERTEGRRMEHRFVTPHGTLSQISIRTVDETWRVVEHAAKGTQDLPALKCILQNRSLRFDPEGYRIGKAFIGDRGEGHFWVPKSPWFALAQQWMSLEAAVYALVDAPDTMDDLFTIIDDSYDPLYEQLTASDAIRILNFGENVADAYLSEPILEHLLPWYEKRVTQLRAAGIYTHIHIDGNFAMLRPYLADLPFDGLEALTPYPQGDVSTDEMVESIGDKILLDGIPAVLFLEHHPMEELQACVERIVQRCHPRLILGVSDELPEGGGHEAWRRIKWVAEYARSACTPRQEIPS